MEAVLGVIEFRVISDPEEALFSTGADDSASDEPLGVETDTGVVGSVVTTFVVSTRIPETVTGECEKIDSGINPEVETGTAVNVVVTGMDEPTSVFGGGPVWVAVVVPVVPGTSLETPTLAVTVEPVTIVEVA